MIVGLAGLSHLGTVSAVASAVKGCDVVAFDPEPAQAALLPAALPFFEPGLDDALAAHAERVMVTADPRSLSRCAVIVIARDVPTDAEGRSDLAPLEQLLDLAVAYAARDAVIVVLSQVPPGFTRGAAGRVRASRPDLTVLYQVETLVFGDALRRAVDPERTIVGAEDPERLPAAYREWIGRWTCPLLPMRYESAELSKIAINLCLIGSLTIANTLADVCEEIGADWSEIVPALRSDRRIGPHAYLAAGLGLSGGNLERDLATVRGLVDSLGPDRAVVEAITEQSRWHREWVMRRLAGVRRPDGGPRHIAVWGLAYKAGTSSTKNSPALALIEALGGDRIRAHDPVVRLPRVAGRVQEDSPLAAAQGADALAVMTPWPEYAAVAPADLAAAMDGRVVVDPFHALDPGSLRRAGFRHITRGIAP